MTRDDIREEVLQSKAHNLLLQFGTGVGKSRMALDFIANKYKKGDKILIVIPKLVLIDNWKEEFRKWKYTRMLKDVTFTTYISLPKHISHWTFIIYDEGHHLTERCYDVIISPEFKSDYSLLLSATVGYNKLTEYKYYFRNLEVHRLSIKEAIDENILPDLRIYLVPLQLDNNLRKVRVNKIDRKTGNSTIYWYTQQNYYNQMCALINWFKARSNSKVYMDLYLRECGKRLKWLSGEKEEVVLNILSALDKERTLTFCNSIEQTKRLGKYCINSKNALSYNILDMFNNGKINHITSISILDEGVNITNCKVGIFAMINSSERMQCQRIGRLLRHKEPVIIIPYYKNTREEEIVNKMIEGYNPELITIVEDLKNFKL